MAAGAESHPRTNTATPILNVGFIAQPLSGQVASYSLLDFVMCHSVGGLDNGSPKRTLRFF